MPNNAFIYLELGSTNYLELWKGFSKISDKTSSNFQYIPLSMRFSSQCAESELCNKSGRHPENHPENRGGCILHRYNWYND